MKLQVCYVKGGCKIPGLISGALVVFGLKLTHKYFHVNHLQRHYLFELQFLANLCGNVQQW